MPTHETVLLVGGTGRTGRRALQQLLDRGIRVRAEWKGKLPVSTNAEASSATTGDRVTPPARAPR